MPRNPTFRCSSCGKAIRWGFIPGYRYGFVHVTGPKTLCETPKHPEPKQEEEETDAAAGGLPDQP